jgi:hypothetical protein
MNVIVTGGAGFIGSHLTEQLLASGHSVTVVDDFSTGQRGNLSSHLSLSILEKNVLDCCAEDFPDRVNAIAHLAAIPSVSQSWDEPLAVHQNNLSTTVALIELCRKLHIPEINRLTKTHPNRPFRLTGCRNLPANVMGSSLHPKPEYISLPFAFLMFTALGSALTRFIQVLSPFLLMQ